MPQSPAELERLLSAVNASRSIRRGSFLPTPPAPPPVYGDELPPPAPPAAPAPRPRVIAPPEGWKPPAPPGHPLAQMELEDLMQVEIEPGMEKPTAEDMAEMDFSEDSPEAPPAAREVPPDDSLDREADRLRGLTSLSEQLGNLKFQTAGDVLLKNDVQTPFRATALRGALDEDMDKARPEEIEMARSAGIHVPDGMRRSALAKLFPSLVNLEAQERSQDFQAGERELDRGAMLGAAMIRSAPGGRDSYRDRVEKHSRAQDLQGALKAERGDWFNPNSAIGKSVEALRAADRLDSLIEYGDPTAIRGVLVSLARLGGDTGVLTERDIKGWEGQIGIPGYFREGYKAITGNYTPGQKQAFRQIGESLRAVAEQVYADEASRRVDSFGSLWGEHLQDRGIDPAGLPRLFGLRDLGPMGGAPQGAAPPSGPQRYRAVPRSDTEAIRYAEENGIPIEIDEDA